MYDSVHSESAPSLQVEFLHSRRRQLAPHIIIPYLRITDRYAACCVKLAPRASCVLEAQTGPAHTIDNIMSVASHKVGINSIRMLLVAWCREARMKCAFPVFPRQPVYQPLSLLWFRHTFRGLERISGGSVKFPPHSPFPGYFSEYNSFI